MNVVFDDPLNSNNKFNWSQELRHMLGFSDANDFPDLLSSWSNRLHPEDKDRVLDAFAAHIKDVTGKTPFNLEYRLMTKCGEYRYFRAVGSTMRDEAGTPIKVAGALEDITDRVQQQEMLENILNTMDSYIYTTDLETDEILFVNKKMIADYRLGENTRGDKCWQHIQLDQTGRCSWCKKDELRAHPEKAVAWEEENPISGNSLYKIDRVINWPGDRKVHLQQGIDITEIKKTQESLREREKMLSILNRAATVILSRKDEAFEEAMTEGVSLISCITDFDKMSVFRNHEKPDGMYLSQIYRWNKKSNGTTPPLKLLSDIAYAKLVPSWEKILASGECINGPISQMSEVETLKQFGCVTVLAVPILSDDDFWGFTLFENLKNENFFSTREVDMLRSASFMLANVVIRNEEAKKIREADEYAKLLLDSTPLACRLWNRNFELLECNEAAVKLFGLKNKQEYLSRYYELSPEYQANKQLTRDKIRQTVTEAFEKGASVYEWMYQLLDGTPIPAENTMVRVPYGDDYVVASYSRDLREQKKMMSEIEYRDNLLRTVNVAASILLNTTDDENIENVLEESMKRLGQSIDVDRVQLWRNEMVDDTLFFVLNYEWKSDFSKNLTPVSVGMRFPYNAMPGWKEKFLRGESINSSFSALSPVEQNLFEPYSIKSIVISPLFINDCFWGFFCFNDCRRERHFLEDEVNILCSAALMMATAVERGAQAASVREAHKRIRLLINATPLGFNLWDRNLNNIETNDTTIQLFGVKTQKEYLERFFDLQPEYQPDGSLSKEKAPRVIRQVFEEGYGQFEWMHQKSDGTRIPSEVTLVRLPYGDDYAVAGYVRDLREQKKMMAEIEHRDALLQTVNQSIDILLRSETDDFVKTLHRCMGMMAQAIEADRMHIFGACEQDGKFYAIRLHEWLKNARPHTDADTANRICYDERAPHVLKTLLGKESIHCLVRDLPDSDRSHYAAQGILALMIVPVFKGNEFWGFVGFDNCHSEQMYTENESIVHSGSLLIASALMRNEYMLGLRDTSAKLEIALADAKRANSAKSSFLAHMSHEIRTPLNAVIGLSELTLGEGNLSHEAESNLENIYSAGATILSIVNDILDISKIESGKLETYPVQYDTPSLINDVVALNIVRIGEKPITFKLFVDENLPSLLYGDDLRVKQIFNNLLSNAFKYTHAGTVTWRVTFERDSSSVWLVSSIQDTGIGMNPEGVQKLFTEYNQVDTKTNRKVEGTGLGLAISKRLVEMMDGTISAESEYGTGSIFHVRLRQKFVNNTPIGKTVADNLMGLRYTLSKRSKDTRLSRADMSYASVLVVDDIAINLDVVKGMLKPYGIKVDCALSGSQAIEMVRAENPRYSAVFMDHMMPGMDGVEAAKIIREGIGTDYARNIPIIALTANAIIGNEEMFLCHGFQDFISKPIDTMKLDSVLRQWVRDKPLEKRLLNTEEKAPEMGGSNAENGGSIFDAISVNGIDLQKALERFSGDEAVLMNVLHSYAANTWPLLANLKKYLEAENLQDYAITVHGIKGSSYAIFAEKVGKAAEALEMASKAGDLVTVKATHPAFEKSVKLLLGELAYF
ncbi:MAG: GAF domain-containing protein [Azoarcus sp.]|nr:GAF domain-containing protein [Azoarcus sp.]